MGARGVKPGNTDAVLEIGAVHIGDMDVRDGVVGGEQAHGAVAPLCVDPADRDVRDRPGSGFVGIQGHQIVETRAFQIAELTEPASAVQVDPVHIGGPRIAMIVIEADVIHREMGHRVQGRRIGHRILESHGGKAQAVHVEKQHDHAGVTLSARHEVAGFVRVRSLVFVVEIPDAARDLDVLCGVFIGKIVDVVPERAFHPFLPIGDRPVFQHEAVGTRREPHLGEAGKDQTEIGGKLQRA